MPWARYPSADQQGLEPIPEVLDPVLIPLGFAAGQVGATDGQGQVIFCRGYDHSTDGECIDLVIDVVGAPDWRITDVRYWGFPSDSWHLDFDKHGDLASQLAGLAQNLPKVLA